ncbi:unnamed protein product [Macrosiphum euphorbiae]|uniref:Uncharacterized protein n=1 Tax=Macrosiphum euphorbiae TaxID=13131 RepID=A0AAV0VZL7_9HEMI|nr:unnamed protein product [Macrosiphum euphorbiae]
MYIYGGLTSSFSLRFQSAAAADDERNGYGNGAKQLRLLSPVCPPPLRATHHQPLPRALRRYRPSSPSCLDGGEIQLPGCATTPPVYLVGICVVHPRERRRSKVVADGLCGGGEGGGGGWRQRRFAGAQGFMGIRHHRRRCADIRRSLAPGTRSGCRANKTTLSVQCDTNGGFCSGYQSATPGQSIIPYAADDDGR